MRALLICGNSAAACWLECQLNQLGYALDVVASAAAARETAGMVDYDVILWDLDETPPIAKSELKSLFGSPRHGGTLLLAQAGELDRVAEALDAGANDFAVKPIDTRQLNLRLGCLRQRQHHLECTATANRMKITMGPLCFDLNSRTVTFDGGLIDVTPRERSILETLLSSNGKVVSKDRIATRIFAHGDEAMPRSIETYVHRLRKKLRGLPVEIATVRGLGYCLRVDAPPEASDQALHDPDCG